MVTITSYNERESKEGRKFYSLTVESEMQLVLSEQSGRYYATAKQASIGTTFDEKTCQGLVGTKLPGKISRVVCEPFDYTVKETGEVIRLDHRWVYNPNEGASLEEVVYEKVPVGAGMDF
jgi:hypothetical protein